MYIGAGDEAQAGYSDIAGGSTVLPLCHGTLDAGKSPDGVLVGSICGLEVPVPRGMVKVTVVGSGAHWEHTATVVVQPEGSRGSYVGAKVGLLKVG